MIVLGHFLTQPGFTIQLDHKRDVFIVAPKHMRIRRLALMRRVPPNWTPEQLVEHLIKRYADKFRIHPVGWFFIGNEEKVS